ncbi:MAG: VCBS repeat-containing protein, partial [Lachnospiraceae bacterium]|nr:VCBS repeat-containing protein [Lachnospiraceae bacterium]
MKKLRYGGRALCVIFSLSLLLAACGNADSQSEGEQSEIEIMSESINETASPETIATPSVNETIATPRPAHVQEEEEVIDNTQVNTERFYQIAEESGLSHEQAQEWFDIVMEDDIFDGGVRGLSGLIFDDIDGNGKDDMVIMVQETNMLFVYGTGALYFYMNQEESYCFADEDFPYFGFNGYMNICYADLNGDDNVEIAFALQGIGNGGVGDWHMALLSYTGNAMERLEIPSDLEDENDDQIGFKVDVIMESEQDTYTAYCPYLDESIAFQASNSPLWEEYRERTPMNAGSNCRGFFDVQVVVWEGRNALQVKEYLYGEGGIVHGVG